MQWRVARLRPQQSKSKCLVARRDGVEQVFSLLVSALGDTWRRLWQRSSFSSTMRSTAAARARRGLLVIRMRVGGQWRRSTLRIRGDVILHHFERFLYWRNNSANQSTKLPLSLIFHANRCVCTFIEKSIDLLWSTVYQVVVTYRNQQAQSRYTMLHSKSVDFYYNMSIYEEEESIGWALRNVVQNLLSLWKSVITLNYVTQRSTNRFLLPIIST